MQQRIINYDEKYYTFYNSLYHNELAFLMRLPWLKIIPLKICPRTASTFTVEQYCMRRLFKKIINERLAISNGERRCTGRGMDAGKPRLIWLLPVWN